MARYFSDNQTRELNKAYDEGLTNYSTPQQRRQVEELAELLELTTLQVKVITVNVTRYQQSMIANTVFIIIF